LREEVLWTEQRLGLLRELLRNELRRVKRQYSTKRTPLSWAEIGEGMGLSRQAVQLYTRYKEGRYVFTGDKVTDPRNLAQAKRNAANRRRRQAAKDARLGNTQGGEHDDQTNEAVEAD